MRSEPQTEKKTRFGVNVLVMAVLWANCAFSYYLVIFYLKYLPGDIYQNTAASCLADLIATLSAGFLLQKFGLKRAFQCCLALEILGGISLLCFEALLPLQVIVTKFGIAGSFNLVYCATAKVFPTA